MAATPQRPNFMRDLEKLAARVEVLEKTSRLNNASVGSGGLRIYGGGKLTVEDGGDIQVIEGGDVHVTGGNVVVDGGGGINVQDNGRIAINEGGSLSCVDNNDDLHFYTGGFGPPGGFGTFTQRPDGSFGILFAGDTPTSPQRVLLYGRDGKALLHEDPSGSGLSWPRLAIPFISADFRSWGGTDQTTFQTVALAVFLKATPRATVHIYHRADAGAGQMRLMINGVTQAGATANVTTSVGLATIGPFSLPGAVGDQVTLEVQTRRTSATATDWIRASPGIGSGEPST